MTAVCGQAEVALDTIVCLTIMFVLQLRTSKKQRVELTDLSYDSYLELEP